MVLNLSSREDPPNSSGAGLFQLLSFSNAVGSTRPMLLACLSQLEGLALQAKLGQQQLQLFIDGRQFDLVDAQLMEVKVAGGGPLGDPAGSEEEKAAFIRQVVAQAEQLQHLAYKLQLEPLSATTCSS
jgi:hypothetical protein